MFSSSKSNNKIETFIGTGTEFEGNIHTSESIRIDGKVKGNVSAETVTIGPTGAILGDIAANKVVIAGRIKGNVSSSTLLELLPTGQVLGDLRTSKLVIADGASFEGNCQMVKSDGQIIELNPVSNDSENGHQRKNLKVVGESNKR